MRVANKRVLLGATAAGAAFALTLAGMPASAQAATYTTDIYNGTVVGSDWGEDGHVRTAKLTGTTLKLGKGSVNRGGTWIWTNLPKGKNLKVSDSCKFYRSFKLNSKGTDYTCSKKVSKGQFKKTLKKANKKIGRGKYTSNHYRLYVKTSKGAVVKLALAKAQL